ncbi:MAG TPA: HAD-IA family hydrolase [Vicinamibacterales bacterium]|nr:HAD-IA family hydrolase [Vicinamibacterales bacterium]
MFQLYVFDLDGTLVDSRRDLADSANELLGASGVAPLSEEHVGRLVGDGAATLVARVFAARAVPQPDDALARFLAIYDRRLLNHTRPYPGIPEVLSQLGARARLAVLTNKPLASTRRILDALDLSAAFDPAAVLGGDGPLPRKPDPAGLRHLAAAANVALSSTLLIGDSSVDLRTARNAGAALCLARYGFGCWSVRAEDLADSDRTIRDPIELLHL